MKLHPSYFFLDRNLLFIDLILDTHSNFKNLQKKKKSKKVIIYQHFLHETYLLLAFVRLRTLVLFFFFFLAFQLFASLNVLFIRPLLPKHLLWEYFTLFSFGGG